MTRFGKKACFFISFYGQPGCKDYDYKKAEEDSDYIVILLELSGKDETYQLIFLNEKYELKIGKHEIQTFSINPLKK